MTESGSVTESGGPRLALIGVDVGTASSKAVAIDVAGRIIARASIAHETDNPRPGFYEHDPDAVWWHDLGHLTRALLEDDELGSYTVAGIAVSAIGPCVLPVDADGRPLRNAILYGIDSRADEQVRRLNEESKARGSTQVYDSQSVLPKLLWIRDNEPDVWNATRRILGAAGYLGYKLTGQSTIDMYESGSYAPLRPIESTEWDLSSGLLDPELLPLLSWSCEPIGTVTAAASEHTGLPVGTTVVCGTIDAAAEATSAGVSRARDLMLMYGSTGFFILLDDEHVPSEGFWNSRFLEPGWYSTAGGTNTLGTLITWFRNELSADELRQERDSGASAYRALVDLGRQSRPGANGVLALPYFAGERTPLNDPGARGVFAGLSTTTTRADLYRAVIEGIGHSIRQNIEGMSGGRLPPARIFAVGGGALNELLLQTVSDITGIQQLVPMETIGASLGDALRAGVGVGIFADLAEATGTIRYRDPIAPDPALRALHDQRHALFREMYRATKSVVNQLADAVDGNSDDSLEVPLPAPLTIDSEVSNERDD